jgi:hypothetical protein
VDQPNRHQNNHSDGHDQPVLTKTGIVGYVLIAVCCLLLLIAGLIILSRWLNTAISDRVQFVTANLLNALIFSAIVAQVLIYRKQRDIMAQQRLAMQDSLDRTDMVISKMGEQLDAIKRQEMILAKQAKTMDQSLVLGTRAYVGIQNVNFDIASKRLFLNIENVGKVPAKDIVIVTEIKAEVLARKYLSVCSQATQVRDWPEKEDVRYLQLSFLNRLGRTRLFPGNLRIPVVLRLDESPYMSDQQLSLITGGYAKFTIRGLVTYSDGFDFGKKTEFAFRYLGRNSLWVPEVIDGPETKTDEEADDDKTN